MNSSPRRAGAADAQGFLSGLAATRYCATPSPDIELLANSEQEAEEDHGC